MKFLTKKVKWALNLFSLFTCCPWLCVFCQFWWTCPIICLIWSSDSILPALYAVFLMCLSGYRAMFPVFIAALSESLWKDFEDNKNTTVFKLMVTSKNKIQKHLRFKCCKIKTTNPNKFKFCKIKTTNRNKFNPRVGQLPRWHHCQVHQARLILAVCDWLFEMHLI